MPFYGENLYKFLKNNPSNETILQITIKMINILEEIHNQGVIHRDIKTENFMLHNEEIYLIDFGLSSIFLDENMNHLGPVIMKLIKDHAESAVTDLICERYYDPLHPENKTVMLKPKEKWPGRKYNGERWEVDDKMSLITDVLKQNFSLLDQVYSVIKHRMNPYCDWTEVRKKWERKDEPSKETKEKTEKILINQSLSESEFRGNVIEDE